MGTAASSSVSEVTTLVVNAKSSTLIFNHETHILQYADYQKKQPRIWVRAKTPRVYTHASYSALPKCVHRKSTQNHLPLNTGEKTSHSTGHALQRGGGLVISQGRGCFFCVFLHARSKYIRGEFG